MCAGKRFGEEVRTCPFEFLHPTFRSVLLDERVQMRSGLRRLTVVLGVLAALPLLVNSASASSEAAQKSDRIDTFVERVHSTWGYTINPEDYAVVEKADGILIARKEQADKVAVITTQRPLANSAETAKAVQLIPPQHPVPAETERKNQERSGKVVVEEDTQWFEPWCEQYIANNKYGEPIGYAADCDGWGSMNYQGATMDNWAYRQNNTCIADWDPNHNSRYELTECGVSTHRIATSAPFVWHGWEPASDMNQSNCTQVSLSVAAGPVTGGVSFNACDLIDMELGATAPEHSASWRGEKAGQQRQVAHIIAIGAARGSVISIGISYGYSFHACGSLGELCD
jgi:hypothetical protein